MTEQTKRFIMILILSGVAIAVKIALDTIKQVKESAHDLDHHER